MTPSVSRTMQATSVLVFAFFVGVSVCFPQDALIGIRFAPLQRQEREIEELIGIRNWDEDVSSDQIAISPKLQRKVVLPTHGDLPISNRQRAMHAGGFCADNMAYYETKCISMLTDRDEEFRKALFKFCPWFENKCLH